MTVIYIVLRSDTMNIDSCPNQKYQNYKEQFKRLNSALSSGFNLEAMFIEYAIIEDRSESVIRHAGLWEKYVKSRKGHEPNIDSKVRYIKKMAENKKDLSHKYFSPELLDSILSWKEDRNRLIHALLKQEFAHNEIAELAEKGKTLASALRTKTSSYERALEKISVK